MEGGGEVLAPLKRTGEQYLQVTIRHDSRHHALTHLFAWTKRILMMMLFSLKKQTGSRESHQDITGSKPDDHAGIRGRESRERNSPCFLGGRDGIALSLSLSLAFSLLSITATLGISVCELMYAEGGG